MERLAWCDAIWTGRNGMKMSPFLLAANVAQKKAKKLSWQSTATSDESVNVMTFTQFIQTA